MQKPYTPFPDYENPPVIEVVCGIHFRALDSFLAPHFGLLWEKFKHEYPTCQEAAPLASVIEQFDVEQPVNIDFRDIPPLPRIWFIHKGDNGIIQVQRDRFLHNWRKIRPEDEYPRYPNVIKSFKDKLSLFESFLNENKIGKLLPLQYEMTYINHIWQGHGWSRLSEIGRVLPDFSFRSKGERFLPEPERINWNSSFLLPNKAGRMHVAVRNAKRKTDGIPMILLDLTVRGFSDEEMEKWFDRAREWIVFGFSDLTGDDIQKGVWRRRN